VQENYNSTQLGIQCISCQERERKKESGSLEVESVEKGEGQTLCLLLVEWKDLNW